MDKIYKVTNGKYIELQGEELEQFLADEQENKELYEKYKYREERAIEYPTIGDQLDALHKARLGDDTELKALDERISSIKEKYPKGE